MKKYNKINNRVDFGAGLTERFGEHLELCNHIVHFAAVVRQQFGKVGGGVLQVLQRVLNHRTTIEGVFGTEGQLEVLTDGIDRGDHTLELRHQIAHPVQHTAGEVTAERVATMGHFGRLSQVQVHNHSA